MPGDIIRAVDIQAAPARVFAVLCDVERWPAWTPTMTRVSRTDSGPFAVGRQAWVLQPKLKAALWTVTEIDSARRFTWASKAPGLLLTAGHKIEAVAAGSHVTLSFMVSGWLRSIALRFYGPLIESYLDTEARSLKAHCEAARDPV